MHGSKLFRSLAFLDASERKAFHKFLDSPFFNHRKDLRSLYSYILQASEEADWTKEKLWKAVYPDVPFDNPGFNRLCSRLLKLVEQFLAHQMEGGQMGRERIALAKAYLDRGASKMAQSAFQEAEKALGKGKFRDSAYLLDRYHLSEARYNASSQKGIRVGVGLREMSADLDLWFVVEKLKHACSLAAQRNVSDEDAPLDFLEEVMEMVERKRLTELPVVGVYFHAYRMMAMEEGGSEYRALRSLLARHAGDLRLGEQRSVFLMAINFCIHSLNSGRQAYLREVYDLYQIGLRDGWLFEQGALSPWTYKNIVSAGLKLRDFEGVAEFVEAYRSRLPEEQRGTFYMSNVAELLFATGRFRETLRTLRYLQFKEALTQLRARILQIMAAYELGEQSMVEYQVANLLKLVKRKKSLAYHRENYRAFARFAKRLVQLWEGDVEGRKSLRKEVEAMEMVVEREWLLEKLGKGEK